MSLFPMPRVCVWVFKPDCLACGIWPSFILFYNNAFVIVQLTVFVLPLFCFCRLNMHGALTNQNVD